MTTGSPAFVPFASSSQNKEISNPPTPSDFDRAAGSGKQKANADVISVIGIGAVSKVEILDGSCESVPGRESEKICSTRPL